MIRNQNGATAVEFAVVLIPLLLLIFGGIEFGLAFFNRQVITNACREGARAGVVVSVDRLSNDKIKEKVLDKCKGHLVTFGGANELDADDIYIPEIGDDPTAIANGTQRCTSFQCDLEVTVTYDYDFLFLSNFGIGPWKIKAVSKMKME